MRHFFIYFSLFIIAICNNLVANAQDLTPTINPTATYIDADGTQDVNPAKSGSAPIVGLFQANPSDADGWQANYEWRFSTESNTEPYLIRYGEETEVTFTTAGQHRIVCYATFTRDDKIVAYTEEYWADLSPLTCTVSESRLSMPNAFSPNGDEINDIYKAKDDYQSIVEFHAIIFNRWGQKLYEWDDPAGGWDGTYNGRPVKDGVYFCQVKAVGADGIQYNIRRDVNLLRGYTENGSTVTE